MHEGHYVFAQVMRHLPLTNKQHLRIKAFFGTSENAVKSQIWIAVSVYVLVAIVKKRLALSRQPLRNSTNPQPHPLRENPGQLPV